MSNDAVTRLNVALEGRYTVERELGEGGMATVYLADDLKHERKVALKVLKPELAAVVGAERFLAEIKTTANLTHPNVLPLHDSGEAGGFLFYVMPYLSGESLHDRIAREKQLPVDEAVRIATAVANALDHAHRQDVIHRDIKPANILLQDGEPVVADFGIALAVGAAGGDRLTETGLSLGTPFYMSPEQATGDQPVGASTDTYALGCVLYEMLTGDPPYLGSTAQAVLGQIIAGEPISARTRRPSIPVHVDAAIRKALEKLPADRFQSVQEFGSALVDPRFRYREPANAREAAGSRTPSVLLLGLALVVTTGLALWGWLRPTRIQVAPSAAVVGSTDSELGVGIGVSADGRTVVFSAFEGDRRMLFRRPVDELDATVIPGTDGGHDPTFSPDGEWLAFKVRQQLKKVRVEGGPVTTLLEDGVAPNGGLTWGPDDRLYFPRCCSQIAISRVSASGGTPEALTSAEKPEEHWVPEFLPDGKMALFSRVRGREVEIAEISMETFEWNVISEEPAIIPRFVPPDHLVYVRPDRQLMTVRFDPDSRQLLDDPIPVTTVDLQDNSIARPQFRTAPSGALVYVPPAEMDLVLLAKGDQPRALGTDRGWFERPVLSPDLRHVILRSISDLWAYDLDRGIGTQLTQNESAGWDTGTWTADGSSFIYADMGAGIRSRSVGGAGVPKSLLDSEDYVEPQHMLAGDTALLVRQQDALRIFDLRNPTGAGRLIPTRGLVRWRVALSPDERWLAYAAQPPDEPFGTDIWIQAFPDPEQRVRVSQGDARDPMWGVDGARLFYQSLAEDGSQSLQAVEVQTTPELRVENAEVIWEDMIGAQQRIGAWNVDVFPNGERAIALQRVTASQVVLIQNWQEWLRRRTGGE